MSSERVSAHLHRPAQLHGRGRGDQVLDVDRRLRTEAATHPRADDPHRFGLEPEDGGQGRLHRMGRLVRDPAGDARPAARPAP